MPKRFWANFALALGVAALGGCGGSEEVGKDATAVVYVSAPLRGAEAVEGRDIADGARLALADAGSEAGGIRVAARYLDDTEGPGERATWTPAKAAANARAATEDSTAIAYLGDFASGATRASLPVTNQADLLQVSAASGAVDLVAPFAGSDDLPDVQPSGKRTFGRVIPSDDAQARAAAGWAERMHVRRVATLSDGMPFGEAMVASFRRALDPAIELTRRRAQLLYYGGVADREPASLTQTFTGTLLVSDAELGPGVVGTQPDGTLATSAALDPIQLPPAGREFADAFSARYGRAPGRYAAYGYEAMAVILDSIGRADDPADRADVVSAFFDTANRDSVLGRYSIDEVGDTTLRRMAGYRLGGAQPRPVAELTAGY